MEKYLKVNRIYMALLLFVILLGTSFTIGVQFLKGEVLNLALSGNSKLLPYTSLLLLIGIILDEPLAHLDPTTMLELEKQILSLKDVTLIFISHVISPTGEAYFDEVITLGA